MSIFGVFLVLIFPRYSVSLRIQSKCGKIRTRKLQIWTLFYAVTSTKDIPGCKDLDYYIHKHWRCLVNRVLRKITSLLKKDNYFFSLFHDGCPYYIETRPLISRANQWTGFYMIWITVMKELNYQERLLRFYSTKNEVFH